METNGRALIRVYQQRDSNEQAESLVDGFEIVSDNEEGEVCYLNCNTLSPYSNTSSKEIKEPMSSFILTPKNKIKKSVASTKATWKVRGPAEYKLFNLNYLSKPFKANKKQKARKVENGNVGEKSLKGRQIGKRLCNSGMTYAKSKETQSKHQKEFKNTKIPSESMLKPTLGSSSVVINLKKKFNNSSLQRESLEQIEETDESLDKIKSYNNYTATTLIKSSEKQEAVQQKRVKSLRRPMSLRTNSSLEKAAQVASFSPGTSKGNNSMTVNFFHRLQNWVEVQNTKHCTKIERSFFDEQRGIPFFEPEINENSRQISMESNTRRKDVFTTLYNRSKRQKAIQEEREKESHEQLIKLGNMKFSSKKSEYLNQDLIKKTFNKLFERLEKNSQISESSLSKLTSLPREIQVFLEPLLLEISEQNENFNREEFINAGKQLYKLLSATQRKCLFSFYFKKEKKIEKHAFSPRLLVSSEKICTNSKKYSQNFYERNKQLLQNKTQKLQRVRTQNFNKEMENCTFKPSICRTLSSSREVYSFEGLY